jgi:hypothetical protein
VRFGFHIELHLIDVAPTPVLARLEGLHDWVMNRVEAFGGLLILGAVAATDMTTRKAQAKIHARVARIRMIAAALGAQFYFLDLIEKEARSHLGNFSADALTPHLFRWQAETGLRLNDVKTTERIDRHL